MTNPGDNGEGTGPGEGTAGLLRQLAEQEERRNMNAAQKAELDRKREKERLNALKEEIKLERELRALGVDIGSEFDRSLEQGQQRLAVKEKELEVAYKEAQIKREAGDISQTELQDARALYVQQLKILHAKQKTTEAMAEGAKSAESAAAKFLGLSKDSGKMFENMGKKKEGFEKKMGELITGANLAGAVVSKAQEITAAIVMASVNLATSQDSAVVAFTKSTSAVGEYAGQIRGLERSMVNAGVTADEAGKAYTDLFTTVTDFSNASKGQQVEMAKTVALLGELGVSTATTAKNIQFLTKVMGQSTKEATAQTRELFTFAQKLGVSAEKIASDFANFAPQIAALGDTGVQAFKDLQAQAKATGLEMDTLVKLASQFDTFSGAAGHVSKLNAILGGPYLNTLEMVAETDPAERMRKLAEGVNSAGLSFDSMSYYQKKALTSAAGLNNEMELSLMMSGKLETARGPTKTSADFEKLAQQTADFTTLMEEMKQMGMSLAVSFGPVLSIFKGIVDVLTMWAPLIRVIAFALAGLAIAFGIAAGAALSLAIAKALGDGGMTMLIGGAVTGVVLGGLVGLLSLGVDAATGAEAGGKGGRGYAKGTPNSGRGTFMVGERGPEMVSLPKGSQVAANGSRGFVNPQINAYADAASGGQSSGGVGGMDINLSGDNEGFLKYIAANIEFKKGVGNKGYDSIMSGVSNELST